MTIEDKITVATEEIKTAEVIVRSIKAQLQEWENLVELRRNTLENLKKEAK